MITINVITLHPSLFTEHLNNLPFKKALTKELIKINIVNLRSYALDSYGTVDDKTYGGGVGMVLMAEPIYNALCDIYGANFESRPNFERNSRIILLTPRGKRYTQSQARNLTTVENITLICGRYEGVDARIEDYATDLISVGDFVLTGGELPALAIMESVTRLLPGVLEKEEAALDESFSTDHLEYPQYTRPEVFRGKSVPKVLLSGNHKEIAKWRTENSPKLEH